MLTGRLTPLLRDAAPSRVINVTSGGQYDQAVPGRDLESDRTRYGPKKIRRTFVLKARYYPAVAV